MRQTCESERENGGNNDAERERTSESEIEDLGARLDKACASRPLDRAQHGMTRRTAATHLLTAVLWLATAVILLAMLLGTVLAAAVSALVGGRMLKKQFEKAGITK